MRTKIQLLSLILASQSLFKVGLCKWIYDLELKQRINKKERIFLIDFLDAYARKNQLSIHKCWSPRGKIKPRIKWIEQQIENLNHKKNN